MEYLVALIILSNVYFIKVIGKDFECFRYSDHPKDRSMYRLHERGQWKSLICRTGTIWNHEFCHCDVDTSQEETQNPELFQAQCNSFSAVIGEPTRYDQLEQGTGNWERKDCRTFDASLVWNQTVCQCVQAERTHLVINVDPDSTACDTIFDSCFDDDALSANGKAKLYIQMTDENRVAIVDDDDSYNGKAVFIQQAPLILPIFLNNELSDSFQIYVRFKLEETVDKSLIDNYQVIFSNKCENQTATISFSYRARDFSYRIVLLNASQSTPMINECSYEAGDRFSSWKSAYIIYQNGIVTLAVNGKPCIQFAFTGYPGFECPLAIGGYPRISQTSTMDETNFFGYIDVMSVDRNCRSPIP